MYKLLPEEARENVRREYLLRRAVIMASALVLVGVVALVGLFPSHMLSQARQKEALSGTQFVSGSKRKSDQELREWFDGLSLKLKTLSPKLDQDRPSENIAQVISEKGSGIRLTSFGWSKKDGQIGLSVSGIARDRQALLSWESRLNESKHFASVSLPVSNLAKDKDISFELKLIVLKQP